MPHVGSRTEVNCFCAEHLTSGARKFATTKSLLEREGFAACQLSVIAGNMAALFGHLRGCQLSDSFRSYLSGKDFKMSAKTLGFVINSYSFTSHIFDGVRFRHKRPLLILQLFLQPKSSASSKRSQPERYSFGAR